MNTSRRTRAIDGFRPLAILLAAAVSVPISMPSPSLAAPLPTLSINDVTMTEGDAGTLTLNFTVIQTGKGSHPFDSQPQKTRRRVRTTSWRGPAR